MGSSDIARARYVLATHAFPCVSGDYVVVLDLRRDRYLALDAAAARGLAAVVSGWPQPVHAAQVSTAASGARPTDEEAVKNHALLEAMTARLAEQLRIRGLLKTAPACDIGRGHLDVPRVEETLCEDFRPSPARVRAREVFLVARSWLLALLMVRFLPLRHVVSRVRRRSHKGTSCAAELSKLRHLVLVHIRLRPYFFSARHACLLDSLALLELLAHHGLYPHWVFGVRTRPFAAHCWVQHDNVVCNDTAERVSRYTPIMAA